MRSTWSSVITSGGQNVSVSAPIARVITPPASIAVADRPAASWSARSPAAHTAPSPRAWSIAPSAASARRPVAEARADRRRPLDEPLALHDRQVGQSRPRRPPDGPSTCSRGAARRPGRPPAGRARPVPTNTPPSGWYPDVTALANVVSRARRRSGRRRTTCPRRPNPVITSSKISKRAVVVAQPAQLGEVAVGGREHAAGTLHRLGDHGGDLARRARPSARRAPRCRRSATCTTSGTSGPQPARFGAMPWALVPPRLVPW